MPTIAWFYGISIYMYWADHGPPHLHAVCETEEAVFDMQSGAVVHGGLRRAKRRMVQAWIEQRRVALLENWRRGQLMLPFERVPGPGDDE